MHGGWHVDKKHLVQMSSLRFDVRDVPDPDALRSQDEEDRQGGKKQEEGQEDPSQQKVDDNVVQHEGRGGRGCGVCGCTRQPGGRVKDRRPMGTPLVHGVAYPWGPLTVPVSAHTSTSTRRTPPNMSDSETSSSTSCAVYYQPPVVSRKRPAKRLQMEREAAPAQVVQRVPLSMAVMHIQLASALVFVFVTFAPFTVDGSLNVAVLAVLCWQFMRWLTDAMSYVDSPLRFFAAELTAHAAFVFFTHFSILLSVPLFVIICKVCARK